MNGKVEFTLKPVTGSAGTHGGFRAEVATGKGDVVGIDGVIAEAINYGYINGIKPESASGDRAGMNAAGAAWTMVGTRLPCGEVPSCGRARRATLPPLATILAPWRGTDLQSGAK